MSPDLHPHISHKISGIVQKGNTGISAFTSQSHFFAGIELVQIWVPEWLVSLVVNPRHQGHCVNPHLTSVVVLSPHNHLILLCISLSLWSIVFTLPFTWHYKFYPVLLCTRLCGLGSTALPYFGFLNIIAYLPKSLSYRPIVALFHFTLVLCNLYIIGRFCLSVCVSRKMITLPTSLKSSSLVVAISFFKHCNKKCLLWIARASKKILTFNCLKRIYF